MANIVQMSFPNAFCVWIKIWLEFVRIDNRFTFVQRTTPGNKPLPDIMTTHFTNVYTIYASQSVNELTFDISYVSEWLMDLR